MSITMTELGLYVFGQGHWPLNKSAVFLLVFVGVVIFFI